MPEFKIPEGFDIGYGLRNKLSGLEGRVGGYMKRENGCIQVLLVTPARDNVEAKENYYFDPPLLEVVSKEKLENLDLPDFPLEYDIGDQVIDPISDFAGTVTEIELAANGCFACTVTARMNATNILGRPDTASFDHRRLIPWTERASEKAKPVKRASKKSGARSPGCAPAIATRY
jgi:hypothetical protein